MAGYQCGGCDGAEPAIILITPLNGAETLAIGDNCMPVTWCGILAGVLDLDPEQLWDAAVALRQAVADMNAQAAEGPPIDKDKCPVCKAGVVIPKINMCAQCATDTGTPLPPTPIKRAPRARRTTK